jgi:hypothetical protein
VTCVPAKKAKKGKVTVTCSVKLASAAGLRSLRARFLKHGKVVATARATRSKGAASLKLADGRLTRGSYDLVMTYTLRGDRVTVRQRVHIR